MGGCPVSVIFDGTTRLGEAMAIVVRFVETDFKIHCTSTFDSRASTCKIHDRVAH